jgi:hypothetical protein
MRRPLLSQPPLVICVLLSALVLVSLSAGAQVRRALPTHMAAPATEPTTGATTQPIRFGITLRLHNVAALQALLKAQQTPGNSRYHQFLSRAQFMEQFGPTQAEYDQVMNFAKAQGFTVSRTFENRMLVNASGAPAQVNKTFAVKMQNYKSTVDGHTYYAPNVEPTVDSALPILSVDGLSTRELPKSQIVRAAVVKGATTGSGTDGQFLGSDIRAAYAPNTTLTGAGQTVGLIELGPYNASDVQAYFSAVNQPLNVPIYNVLLDVDGVCSNGCDDGEEVIDIQQAISMAPGLAGVIVYEAYGSGSDAMTAYAQAASDDVAKQLSLSFTFGGTPSTMEGYEQVFMELAAQGQNVLVASGDSGAHPGDLSYPGNSPNVTNVGGTDLITSGPGGTWQSETTWVGSTGGWNTGSVIPSYQTPVINSANQGSAQFRNASDIAAEANTDNFFCANGSCQGGIGGTSLASPRWAGFLALANEQANGNAIGFVNPTFYALGQTSNYTTAFHDITQGNDFNANSPSMFSAAVGFDLVTGWGSPNGNGMLETLAPPALASAPNFTLTVASAQEILTPGQSASTAISLAPTNGFAGTVDLTVAMIGSPAGLTATLDNNTLSGSGSTTLNLTTSANTPGGNMMVAVTGSSGSISHTAYIEVSLPDFSIAATPNKVYLNQSNMASSKIAVTDTNGFTSPVSFSLAGTPPLVTATLLPEKSTTSATLNLKASVIAPTGTGAPLTLTGTSAGTSHVTPVLSVAISAGLGDCGLGTPVDLSKSYNLTGIRSDNSPFTDGGLDGGGSAYSATVLTTARTLNGIRFKLGSPNVPNVVFGTGQTIALPEGSFVSLQFIATGIEGNQAGQVVTVTYTDGSTSQFSQSFSDWFTPSTNVNEGEAVAMPYRNLAAGTPDSRQFNVYAYTLLLNGSKTVKSVTLPNNRDVVVLAASLSDVPMGVQVNLAKSYNLSGIVTDGSTFSPEGGLDGGGTAYSANLLQDTSAAGENIVVGPSEFHLAGPNVEDGINGTGQTINLPAGFYSDLKLLATAVQGNQTSQTITIHYLDGTSDIVQQSFSDWSSFTGFSNESLAIAMAYRDNNDGTVNNQTFNAYLYTLPLKGLKPIKSITLPNNPDVVVLAVTLDPSSAVDLEPLICPVISPFIK